MLELSLLCPQCAKRFWDRTAPEDFVERSEDMWGRFLSHLESPVKKHVPQQLTTDQVHQAMAVAQIVWRWDGEINHQVWQNCADVTIAAALAA